MEETFFSYVLFYEGSGTPALARRTASLQPGKLFHLQDSSEKVFLAGGFPDLTPQSEVSLSPTLQLNSDLASFSNEELRQIGQAELKRLSGAAYRSYTRNPDFRVATLALTPQSLTLFLETYGGVLEIEPFLLKGHDSDYPTIDDLQIQSGPSAYTLEYTVRTPVDLSLCSYCGLCGPVCPENCLTENLFLDLSRCSYCNECIRVCPSGAIDLYRAEKHALDIPAIVLLDNPPVELPPENQNIYTPETLDKLFSNLVPIRIDETVSLNPSLCQFSTKINKGCEICLRGCPHGALTKSGDSLTVNHLRCTECGACLSSCPTGALQYQRFDDKQFVDWFSSLPIPEKCTIVLGSEKHLHSIWWKKNSPDTGRTLFLEYPNVRALTSMHLLFLLSLGAAKIVLLDSSADLQNTPVSKQIQLTNSILAALFGGGERITVTTPATIKKISPKVEPIPLKSRYSSFSYINRREKLASILLFLLNQKTVQAEDNIILTGPVFETFGTVACDSEKCTHCGACLNDCKVEALTADDDTLSLNHVGILCIQCGTCVAVCPENALELEHGLILKPDFFRQQELTRAEAMICRECGKPFGTKKSFDHVMAKLKTHSVTNDEFNFFEYCEKCRVVKLFESQQT